MESLYVGFEYRVISVARAGSKPGSQHDEGDLWSLWGNRRWYFCLIEGNFSVDVLEVLSFQLKRAVNPVGYLILQGQSFFTRMPLQYPRGRPCGFCEEL